MRIATLQVENFRSYKERMVIENLPGVTVLIGPNNSGKSNLIQALLWYQATFRGQEYRPFTELFHTGNHSSPLGLKLEFEFDDGERQSVLDMFKFKSQEIKDSIQRSQFLRRAKHEIQFDPDGLHTELLAVTNFSGDWLPTLGWSFENAQTIFRLSGLSNLVQGLTSAQDIVVRERRDISTYGGKRGRFFDWILEAKSAEMRIRDIIGSYIERIYWVPPIRHPSLRATPGQDILVESSGGNLVRVLNTIQTEDPDRFVNLTKEIYKIVPGLSKVTAPPRGGEITAVIREPGGVRVELRDASSGLQQVLILATSLLTFPKNSLVLIEEPEIHLHASSQRALFRLIKQLAQDQGHQFLITTHSTIFTEFKPESCIYLIEKREGSSRYVRLESKTNYAI